MAFGTYEKKILTSGNFPSLAEFRERQKSKFHPQLQQNVPTHHIPIGNTGLGFKVLNSGGKVYKPNISKV